MAPSAYFLMRHDIELSEELARRIFNEAASKKLEPGDRDVTPEDHDRWVQLVLRKKFECNIPGFSFRRSFKRGQVTHHGEVRMTVGLHQGIWDLGPGRIVRIEPLLANPRKWASIKASSSDIDPSEEEDAAWFIERVRPFLPIFSPSFAIGDTAGSVVKNIGSDPRETAWPIMVFGPEHVARVGRTHLLSAPVWRAEELPYGGIWLQVSPNPFIATRAEVRALANHLGLKAPR